MICTCFNLNYIGDIPVIDTTIQITQLPQYIASELVSDHRISRFACVWCSYEKSPTPEMTQKPAKLYKFQESCYPLVYKSPVRGNSSPFTPSQAGHLPPSHPPPCLHSTPLLPAWAAHAHSFSAPPARSRDPPLLSPVPYLLCAVLTD